MPIDPPNSTPVPPDAPRAAPAASFVPWEIAFLSGIGNPFEDDDDPIDIEAVAVVEIEFLLAPYAPASPTQWTTAPVQGHTTVYQITSQESPSRPSQEEPISPIYLQRSMAQDEPVALPATAQAPLRDIAGSPLTSPPAGFDSPWMLASALSNPDELLSSPSDSHPVLRHVTPEFDSTHRVMRIPLPRDTLSTTAVSGEAALDTPNDTPEARHTPAFSWTLENARVEWPSQLATTTPHSAPSMLEWLSDAPPPLQNMLDSALAELEFGPMPVLLRLPAVPPPVQTSAQSSDDEAVQIVGNHPAM